MATTSTSRRLNSNNNEDMTMMNKKMDTSRNRINEKSVSLGEWKQIIIKTLDDYEMKMRSNERIRLIEDKYLGRKLPLVYLIIGMIIISFLSMIYIYSGMRALSNIVGVVYPFYMSLKILNVQNINEINKTDNMLWLSYWIWYGIFTMIERISDVLLFWMGNMYELIKMCFYVYLYHPHTKGSLFLYHKILHPLLTQFIYYEHALLQNFQTLRKNITINDHDQQQQQQQQQNTSNNMTNTSANTSKTYGINSSGNDMTKNMNMNINNPMSQPYSSTTPNMNMNMNMNSNPSYGFQPVAFAATTPLNNTTNIPTPIVSAAPLNTQQFNSNFGPSS